MRVHIPSALRSYTGRQSDVEADAGTVAQLLEELDRRYPGFRFRVVDEQGCLRPHIRVSVNTELVGLDAHLRPDDAVALIMAFSGG